MVIKVRRDDLTSAEVQQFVRDHLLEMHRNSPPCKAHALAVEGLQAPEVTFWCAWYGEALCGCGALKELDRHTGEIKSMRTHAAFLRRGVGQAILDTIIRDARERRYTRLLLETGTGAVFAPAHALYLRNGFEWTTPFAGYAATEFNVFMAKDLSLVHSG